MQNSFTNDFTRETTGLLINRQKQYNSNPPVRSNQANYLDGHKSMAMTKRYDHANEERYGGAIEALDEAGKTGKAQALAAASGSRRTH